MSSPPLNIDVRSDSESEPEPGWTRRKYDVPRRHGELLIVPTRSEIPEVIRRNAAWAQSLQQSEIQSRSLPSLRREFRGQLLQAAVAHTSRWTSIESARLTADRPLFISGHQPQLVHPGAWAKNLLLGLLAQEHSAVGLNLVVDNDLSPNQSLIFPAGSQTSPRLEQLPFDASQTGPWEEIYVQDPELARTFPLRVQKQLEPWNIEPVLPQVWSTVTSLIERERSWPTLLTAARNRFERTLGIENLEIPVSHLSELPGFRFFTLDLLRRLEDFQAIHNRLLAEFRETYRIRSTTHPVPELRQNGSWRESPFWVWKAGETRRRPLLLECSPTRLRLGDGNRDIADIEADPRRSEDWQGLLDIVSAQGWKIRPRALTLTLFARVFLADLFIHGIGGARYDEMTDRLIHRFYGIQPPEFLTASAGWLLPLQPHSVTLGDEQRLRHQLWDLQQNPERHLPSSEWSSLLKSELQALAQSSFQRERRLNLEARRDFHRRISLARRELTPRISTEVDRLQQKIQEARHSLAANQVLNSREFSFALFPEPRIRELLARLKP